jgi:xylan 1,4-beta-xylosidase
MPRYRRFSLPSLVLVLAACTAGQSATVGGDAATSNPRFDWFSYEGSDSVFKTLAVDSGAYTNPILAGFYPDPSIVRAGDDYYLVNSSFVYFPGVPIFHSRDLVNWTQIGHILDRPSQLKVDSLGISRGIFAPAISYHDSTFYMITTAADAGGNFVVTAKNAAGPWSEPAWLEFDGIDPSLFFDDDGRSYIVNNGPPVEKPLYNGHRAIWLQQWDRPSNTLVGPRKVIVDGGVDLSRHPIWIEAPHIFKKGGRYYLICAEGGTADQHSEVVFRADSLFGPYRPFKGNPILTQRQLDESRPFPITTTGHAEFVQTPGGEWWAVFLGARPYQRDTYNTGRETFMLPVTWHDGWPTILEGNATVPWAVKRPALPRQAASTPATSGNFVDRDEFDGKTLRYEWEMIRTPHEQWYDLTSAPGWLTIRARSEKLGELGQPSFLGRRQQHLAASASTAMRYAPERPGDEAGITAFQNDDHFYLLAVANDDGTVVVRLERALAGGAKGATEVLAAAPLSVARNGVTYLKIQARGPLYDFYYGRTANEWTLLAKDVDGTILSTKKAGGFVGTMFGMYAHAGAPGAGSQ